MTGVFHAIRTCSECLGTSSVFTWGRTHKSFNTEQVLVIFFYKFVFGWFYIVRTCSVFEKKVGYDTQVDTDFVACHLKEAGTGSMLLHMLCHRQNPLLLVLVP